MSGKISDKSWWRWTEAIEKQNRMAIAEIFRVQGEEAFRKMETDFLKELRPGKACGGPAEAACPCRNAMSAKCGREAGSYFDGKSSYGIPECTKPEIVLCWKAG